MNIRLASLAVCTAALVLGTAASARAAGGGTTCDTTPVLPTTPPAPGVIMRESFGLGNQARPAGGKGCLKFYGIHTALSGFWIEYPGSKNTTWLTAPETGPTWRVCQQTDDPNELPSPLQAQYGNGCIVSDWTHGVTDAPTTLVSFKAPATTYEASIDGWPAPVNGAYVAIGFTDSALLLNNLESAGRMWLLLKEGPTLDNTTTIYEFRLNGVTGPLLATGQFLSLTFNQMAVRYDPVRQLVGASINGVDLGSFPLTLPNPPKFVAFEGVGILDNFVVMQAQ